MKIRYCPTCGAPVKRLRPPGDDRERAVCEACTAIHYVNPKVVCGCILTCGGEVLLARRAIEPRRGFWTFPAGFMELGETTVEAAVRECREEVCAEPADVALYGIVSLPRISQVYVLYRGIVRPGAYDVGAETEAVYLSPLQDLPWGQMAFPVVELALRRFAQDRQHGRFPVFEHTVTSRPGEPLPSSLLPKKTRQTNP